MADRVKPPLAERAEMGGRRSGKTYRDMIDNLLPGLLGPMSAPGDRVEFGVDPAHGADSQMVARIHRQGYIPRIHHIDGIDLHRDADHLRDALQYGIGTRQVSVEPAIEKHSDAEMVMEMIRRGYAVMKLPADGGPPESMR